MADFAQEHPFLNGVLIGVTLGLQLEAIVDTGGLAAGLASDGIDGILVPLAGEDLAGSATAAEDGGASAAQTGFDAPGATGSKAADVPKELMNNIDPEEMNDIVAARMKEIGVPESAIGNVDRPYEDPGAFVMRNPAVGGTQSVPEGRPANSVDSGIFLDNLIDVPGWSEASIQDRIDVISAHEWTEVNTPVEEYEGIEDPAWVAAARHDYAIANAYKTELTISDTARAILKAQAELAGFDVE